MMAMTKIKDYVECPIRSMMLDWQDVSKYQKTNCENTYHVSQDEDVLKYFSAESRQKAEMH